MDWFFFFVEMMSTEELTLWIGLAGTVVSSLAYPLSIFGVFWLFRTPLRSLIGRIKEGEFAGNKVSFRQQQASEVVEELKTQVSEQKETIASLREKLSEQRTNTQAEQQSLSDAKGLLETLAADTEDLNKKLYIVEEKLRPPREMSGVDLKVLSAVAYFQTQEYEKVATFGDISNYMKQYFAISDSLTHTALKRLKSYGYVEQLNSESGVEHYRLSDRGRIAILVDYAENPDRVL